MKVLDELKRLAQKGNSEAMFDLSLKSSADGNAFQSKYWMNKAVASNHPEALYFRAIEYFKGTNGFAVDYPKAYQLFNESAKRGHIPASLYVAIQFRFGLGVKPDRRLSKKIFKVYRKYVNSYYRRQA